MGLFKNMGRKFEEFKKTSEEVAAEGAEYECSECGKHLYTDQDDCPDCGGNVVAREPQTDTEDEADSTTADEMESTAEESESVKTDSAIDTTDDESQSANSE